MPVGIENLATGFLQGLNAKKQQERQDVIDQREAERFDMQKQQFTDQQAANALSMKTNQFQLGQAQAKAEREKILQEKEDKFRKQWEGFARPFAMGNDQEGYNALERTYNDLGYMGKGAFKRDAQGNVLLDDKGNITFLTYGSDGKPTSKSLNKDQMIEGFINSYDPLKHWEYEQKTAAEIAAEERKLKNEIKLIGLNAANAEKLAYINNKAKDRQLDKQINWRRNQSQNTIGYDTNGNMVLVDKNSGETMPVRGGISTKPPVKLPSTALKMQQELVDTIGTLGATNTRLSNIVGQLESGKLDLSPTARAAAYVRNNTNNSNENSRNLSALQATLEELRNASLRLNTGVQTDGDAQRAWSEIAANPNDTELVKSRLKFIVQKNQEAAQLKKLQIEQLRQNFSQPQLQNYGDGSMSGQGQIFDFNDLPD